MARTWTIRCLCPKEAQMILRIFRWWIDLLIAALVAIGIALSSHKFPDENEDESEPY